MCTVYFRDGYELIILDVNKISLEGDVLCLYSFNTLRGMFFKSDIKGAVLNRGGDS